MAKRASRPKPRGTKKKRRGVLLAVAAIGAVALGAAIIVPGRGANAALS